MNILDIIQRSLTNALPFGIRPEPGHRRNHNGTANPKTLARRRAKNKVARRSRAINRHN